MNKAGIHGPPDDRLVWIQDFQILFSPYPVRDRPVLVRESLEQGKLSAENKAPLFARMYKPLILSKTIWLYNFMWKDYRPNCRRLSVWPPCRSKRNVQFCCRKERSSFWSESGRVSMENPSIKTSSDFSHSFNSPLYRDVLDTLFRPSKRFIWQLCTESLVQFDTFVLHSRSKSNNLIYSNVLYFLENLWIYFRQLTVWILSSECLKQIPGFVQSEPFSRKLFSLRDWTQRHKLIHSSKIMKNASKHRNVF